MPDDEKRGRGDLTKHFLRWKAVELVRGRRPEDPRNYKKKVHGDAVWVEAAKLVAGTDAEASAETVRKSYALIRRAGGALVTLPNYRREVSGGAKKKIRVNSCGPAYPGVNSCRAAYLDAFQKPVSHRESSPEFSRWIATNMIMMRVPTPVRHGRLTPPSSPPLPARPRPNAAARTSVSVSPPNDTIVARRRTTMSR